MFATLLGSLPRPPLPADASPLELLAEVVRTQEAAGLEPIVDAGFGVGATPVDRWRATAALTDRPVKATLLGPYSATRATGRADDPTVSSLAAADLLRADLLALVDAGCPLIEVHEPAAVSIGIDDRKRARFRDAHRRLLDGVSGVHMSLAITGGGADATGVATLLASPYASLAVDLIAGPDNWRLVANTPADRGIICGALSVERDADDRVEILLWAAAYAASTGGRGRLRVGLATASSLAALPWEVAVRKVALLGEAARLADLPPDERARAVDPRSLDSRSAATGRYVPRRRRAG